MAEVVWLGEDRRFALFPMKARILFVIEVPGNADLSAVSLTGLTPHPISDPQCRVYMHTSADLSDAI